jgi:tight adherence protein C
VIVPVLAVAWGALVALAAIAVAERVVVVPRRARQLRRTRRTRSRFVPQSRVARWRVVTVVVAVLTVPVRMRRARRRDEQITSELPVAVDLVAVAVGAGCSTHHAVEIAARWGPRHVARVFDAIGRATALGATLDTALAGAAAATPPVHRLTETLRSSARLGAPASSALAGLAHEVRADVRRRAETRARRVPVRLLFPLVFCVLPAFALLTVVPVLLDGIPR